MPGDLDWVPPGIDTRRANAARVYDYLLGGDHNFLADQDVARTLLALDSTNRALARANRAFLGRAVRFLAGAGIRQFLDIGSGIPTQGNVHEIAQRAAPGARVAYADVDPVAVAHSRAMLAGNADATTIEADLREPERILSDETTLRLIDFGQPVGLILAAVLHFVAAADDPWHIVATLSSRLAPGSYVVISHGTHEGKPEIAAAFEKVYNRNVTTSAHPRSRAEILRFFDGLDLLDPGLVTVPNWRPDPPGAPGDADQIWGLLGGVARKPLLVPDRKGAP